ncbi:glycosyltransferase family 39 protein [Limnothrix sp. FACHB-1083]|uniref:ArnT family glycosyltransferase n=1 Tax=unclassified Limnothrix TaxID=2632864 RepID=UPI0016818880|nr:MULTISPECIES: glycosyltransferase family 39 protein [unclassified Limnothrix]MBD2159336.1 glycosyltransferase family 39 protein [Limnothrix sp. FACHB-1083]MBD2193167.1 glycosyltransferase family 39 protein [Limnothrix sp. FACHB-1088]
MAPNPDPAGSSASVRSSRMGAMARQLWRRDDRAVDWAWAIGLGLLALVLYGINLGGLPLRDWDEGTVAQVARELARVPIGSEAWWFPTLHDRPYFNKPPLLHWAIALLFRIFGESEWAARLPGALLGAAAVPLVFAVGRLIFTHRAAAIFSALVYLTWLPVVRHGRLAMLDAAIVAFGLLAWCCLLRARRDLRWTLGIGFALGAIALLKGLVALLFGGLIFGFLVWDTPRLLRSPYLWLGGLLGLAPALAWYGAQWQHYGPTFFETNLLNQSLRRVWDSVSDRGGPPWFYLQELLELAWPWLFLLPAGFQAAWRDRDWPWGKLVLVWSLGYLLPISVMETKLPWYGLPLYPPLALAIGPLLGSLWEEPPARFGRSWQVIFGLLALGGGAGAVYFSFLATPLEPMLALALAALGLTGGAVVLLAQQGDRQLIPVAFWGMFVGLTLFFSSGSWLWELNEQYPVRPVANLLRSVAHSGSKVYTSDRTQRPSLDFYCHCEVIPVPQSEQAKHWADRRVSLWVIRPQDRDRPPFKAGILVGKAGDRLVIRRSE